jgi:hypothetical protein
MITADYPAKLTALVLIGGSVAIEAIANFSARKSRQGRQRYKGYDLANPFAFGLMRCCD